MRFSDIFLKKYPFRIGLITTAILLMVILSVWAFREIKNILTQPYSEGFVHTMIHRDIEVIHQRFLGVDVDFTQTQQALYSKRLENEIPKAMVTCAGRVGEKLFFDDIWVELHRGENIAEFLNGDYLIDIHSLDDSTYFFAQEVGCTYNPVTGKVKGIKYPTGLNILGWYQEYN